MARTRIEKELLQEAIPQVKAETEQAFINQVDDTYRALVDATPVDTGFMVSRWEQSIDETQPVITAEIRNDTEYLPYVNEGSSTQPAQRFVEQAVLSSLGTDAIVDGPIYEDT